MNRFWTFLPTRRFRNSLLLAVAALLSGSAANALNVRTAEQCGVDLKQPAQKIFANPNGKKVWKEYKTVKDIPEISNGYGSTAFYWSGSDGQFLIQVEEPGEDFNGYTDYCFNRLGNLTGLRYELRTAWGWGFREEGTIEHGSLQPSSTNFFDTKTDKKVPRPDMADDIPDALKPRIYLLKSQLPFSRLLPK